MSAMGLDAKANTLTDSQVQSDVKLRLGNGLSFQRAKIHTLIISKNMLHTRSLSPMFPPCWTRWTELVFHQAIIYCYSLNVHLVWSYSSIVYFIYTHSIIAVLNLRYYGSLGPQIKNFVWYSPARCILIFIHKKWVGSG